MVFRDYLLINTHIIESKANATDDTLLIQNIKGEVPDQVSSPPGAGTGVSNHHEMYQLQNRCDACDLAYPNYQEFNLKDFNN